MAKAESQEMRYRRISILLLSLSIILWTVSTRLSHLEIGDYGLIHSLRPEYFVSLFLLTTSFLILLKFDPKARFLLGFHLVVFALFLILPSIILESTPRGTFTYLCATCVESIQHTDHIHTSEIFYLQWPGLHILGAELGMVMDMDTPTIMFWFPLLLQLLLLLVAALLFRCFLSSSREFWVAMWLVLLFPPLFGNLFLPMNAAVLLLMLTVGVILWSRSRFGKITQSGWIVMVLLLAAMTTTHALTSVVAFVDLFLLFAVIVLALGWKTSSPLRSSLNRTRHMGKATAQETWAHVRRGFGLADRLVAHVGWESLALLIICATFIVAWQFLGIDSLGGGGGTASLDFTNPESGLEAIEELSYGGSEAHTRVVNLRIIYGAIISLLALGVFLKLLTSRTMDKNTVVLAACIAVTSIALMCLSRYGGEMLARAFWYAAPWLCILAARCVNGKILTGLLVVILLISPVLLLVFRYGNEAMDYVPPGVVASAEFAIQDLPADKITLETIWAGRLWVYELYGSDLDVRLRTSPLSGAQYVAMSQSSANALYFFEGINLDEYEQGLGSYKRIYANGEAELYVKE